MSKAAPGAYRVPEISVVICAYTVDRWDDLKAAVASVKHQSVPVSEIILVIDHNPELLRRSEQNLDGITIVPNSGLRGLSGARNTGWREATSDVIAFLDDDAVADRFWIEALRDTYSDSDVVAAGGYIEPCWQSREPEWFPDEFLWVVGCSYRGLPEEAGQVRNVIGANMSIRRSALELVDGFSTELGRIGTRPLGCEETELCLRIGQARRGSMVMYEPAAVVHHNVSAARATWSYFIDRCFAEGLSKAHVGRLSKGVAALSTEHTYVRTVLPRAVGRAFVEAATTFRVTPLLRAAAIVAGLSVTAAGYANGVIRPAVPSAQVRRGRDRLIDVGR